MPENKTQPTSASVADFIAAVDHAGKRADAVVLDAMFRSASGLEPVMWGPSIIGYGAYHYRYASGHEGDMCRIGFSPRKAKHSLYLLHCGKDGEEAEFAALRAKLGKYASGAGCMYINKLADVDLAVLEQMVQVAWRNSLERFPD